MTETDTTCSNQDLRPVNRARIRDIAIVLLLAVIVISIGVHAPGHSYSYAQMRQMGATVGMIESGNWVLPRNHEGRLARKPQLYSWLTAPVLLASGVYNDFTFRWPSVAASLGCAVLVYLLALRWCGRHVGILAAVLWTTSLHMGKLMYLGTTDMLNTFWLMLAILCADRILLGGKDQTANKRWAVGLWFSIIMGAMTKGWGVANLPLIFGWIALVTGLGPGFKTPGDGKGVWRKISGGIALVWNRWRVASGRIGLLWGILAFALVLGPIWGAMFHVGGEDFNKVIQTEIWKRIVGGENAPKPSSAPTLAWLLFYTLPGSALALGAMTFTRPRKWLSNSSTTALPLWWIIAVCVPFSLAHGFRPDYLLPCYVSVAILGASGVNRLSSMGPRDGRWASTLRHLLAFVVISVCVFTVGAPLVYLYHEHLPEFMRGAIRMPVSVAPETWYIMAGIAPIGIGMIAIAVRASLRWRIATLMVVLIVGMLGVLFIDRHMISRHAQTGDGETMIKFAHAAGKVVGDDAFAICGMEKAGTELYWGRFGKRIKKLSELKSLNADVRWFVTCDLALTQLGARRPDPLNTFFHTQHVGVPVELNVNRIVDEDNLGKLYLFRLQP
jgi:4-amino-4-deoxy-L-arabinose transferase-like glycosyltransferase